MGAGKAQPLDSLLYSKDGYIKMRDIQINNMIYGEDGFLHSVIGIYPQGIKKVYKITFSDGVSTECCNEHLWTYQKPQDKAKDIYRTESLDNIMKQDLYKITNRGDKNWQFYIPITKPLQFGKKKLNIHPYVLGTLLGDGYIAGKTGSISITNPESDIIQKVSKLLGNEYSLNQLKNEKITYNVVDNNKNIQHNIKGTKLSRIKLELNNLGLLGKKSDTKFIPESYLTSDIEDRIEILKGLIDTDGEIDKGSVVFSTTSERLANQVKFLVQSLSGTATISNRQTSYTYDDIKKDGLPSYRLYIKMPNNIQIFSSNKHKLKIKKGNTNPLRTIREISFIGEKECQCILVDNNTHLYLTNDLIVTHNTSSAINFINNSNEDIRFLYITPYLTEVKRIIESCPNKKFRQPDTYGTKLKGIKYLFESGYNIVSTHALFSSFDEEIIDLAYSNNYTLIMDEVADVIEPLHISKYDLNMILENYTHIEDGHILKWDVADYTGDFDDRKRQCDLGCIAIYNNTAILWLFPISTFRAFRNIYILTYMFNAQTQKYYYDYYNVEYNYLYISGNSPDTYSFTQQEVKYNIPDYKSLIHICDNDKLNQIGDMDKSLCKNWYDRNQKNTLMKKLKNATGNYFKNYTRTKSNENLWTTFKDYQSLISGKGYAKGFLSSNIRATNEYRDRTAIAYLINKFFNPYVKNFFVSNGVEVDEDAFAVSEMLQFIWRSAIREGNEIWVYVPSSRMRMLLERWINDVSRKEKLKDNEK